MDPSRCHQCLIYEGSPSRHLQALAAHLKLKLKDNYRCLHLNSPVMVAGMRCYLAAQGLDVAQEVAKSSLILASDQRHLVNGRFDVDRMMGTLEDAVDQALNDGYAGLWATGDMTWELGPEKDFSKLVEYEWRLEEFFQRHPGVIGGVCQYHADTLTREVLRQGLAAHPAIFVNETLAQINPHYLETPSRRARTELNPAVESTLDRLCHSDQTA